MKKKIFTKARYLLALVSLVLLGTNVVLAATDNVFTYTLNGTEVSDPAGFFTHDTSGNFNFNNKFKDAEYAGISFTSGLKMESSTKVQFTTTKVSTVTIVWSTWAAKNVKFDDNSLLITDATSGTGCYIYTLNNVATGNHYITRGDGENGLFYVKVEYVVSDDDSRIDLQAAVAEAEAIDLKPYTAETAQALKDAIEAAKKLLENDSATNEELDAALEKLNEAKNALVKIAYGFAWKWDFTKWSETTVANLIADAAQGAKTGWSDDEKGDGTTNVTNGNCFWAITTPNANGYLSANGAVIEELDGLKFSADYTDDRALAIAVNYPSTSLGTYHGASYLWLGGKGTAEFTIPYVKAGTTIKMGVESHSETDARGVELYIGDTKISGPETPTVYTEQEWTVPAGNTVDIVVKNTNGCHIYYIEVEQDLVAKLKALIAETKALDLDSYTYTKQSAQTMKAAITAAEEELESDDATEEELKGVLETLIAAKAALTEDPLGTLKAELEAAIAKAELTKMTKSALYTGNTIQALADAIATAKAELASDEATKDALTTAKNGLETADNALSEKRFSNKVTYAVQLNDTHTSGETIEVKNGDELVATVTFGFEGGKAFTAAKKAEKDSELAGFVAYTEGNGDNGTATSGTAYIIKPEHDGIVEIGVILNADKAFFVLEDGTALDDFNGIKLTDKIYDIIAFNVKAGKEYTVYCTGSKLGFYGFNCKYNVPVTTTITAAQYATFYAEFDATIPAGVTAYGTTLNEEKNAIVLTAIEGKVIPAKTAVILYSETIDDYTFTEAEEAATEVVSSALTGTAVETSISENDYVLGNGSKGVGFYHLASGVKLGANQAYLTVSEGARVAFIGFGDNTVTAIDAVAAPATAGKAYNLNGVQVAPNAKGVVIMDGKKVVIK